MEIIRNWFRRNFSDPQVVILAVLLIVGFSIVVVFGEMLAPVLAALVIAYLLEGLVAQMLRFGIPRVPAFLLVFCAFMGFLAFVIVGVLPSLYLQLGQLVDQIPDIIAKGKKTLDQKMETIPEQYQEIAGIEITSEMIRTRVLSLLDGIQKQLVNLGQQALEIFFASLRGIIVTLIYLILIPLLVFFFLKDKELLINWIKSMLPENRGLADQVWHEVDTQMGNYIRGKFWEIFIVWIVSHVTFSLFGLHYSMLISLLIGLSVIFPYVGATVMVVPVALLAYFQPGLEHQFFWILLAYLIIQILDGNLLAPLLLSEVTNLHPIAVIVSLLVFGGIWGFWGVFFAIPLATLVNAVIKAWPTRSEQEAQLPPEPTEAISD